MVLSRLVRISFKNLPNGGVLSTGSETGELLALGEPQPSLSRAALVFSRVLKSEGQVVGWLLISAS